MHFTSSSLRLPFAVLACCLTATMLNGCATPGGGIDSNDPEIQKYEAVQVRSPDFSRVHEFVSLSDLKSSSSAIVVVQAAGSLVPDPIGDEMQPLADQPALVERSIFGTITKNAIINIVVESALDSSGHLYSDKLKSGQTYLLYLTDYRPRHDVYAITGYRAGQFEEVGTNEFGRVDVESPRLPIGIVVTDSGLRPISAD